MKRSFGNRSKQPGLFLSGNHLLSAKQTLLGKLAPGKTCPVFSRRWRLLLTGCRQFVWVLSVAMVFTAASGRDVAATNTGCSGGNCPDVPVDGISYTSGINTVNVGDGVPGTTEVEAGVIGINLRQSGVNRTGGVEIKYYTVSYDIDGDNSTPPVNVVSEDDVKPLEIEGDFIIDNGDETYTYRTTDYDAKGLADFLEVNGENPGGNITGSLTINNPGPNPGLGADFITNNADGIHVESTGGNAGTAGWFTILLASWGFDGKNGGNAGSVAVNNNALITVIGTGEGHHGISAISQGGRGGKGGYAGVAALSFPGEGGNGGNAGDVSVMLGTESNITTHGFESHGLLAKSQGGNGGAAGDADGIAAFGDTGGNGGDAGDVKVNNAGIIMTLGENSNGIYAKSVGAGAGSGSDTGGAYAEGGNGGGESYGASVTVNNSGTITTDKSDSFGILAQSIGGGGGDGGGAGGWFTVGGRGGSGGGSGVVTVNDSGTVETNGDRSTAIFAQSIGGGGGNGGDAVSVAPAISVAIGGNGGLGGDGHEVHVTTEDSDIDTSGDDAHGIHAQSVGGGGGNGGVAVAVSIPAGPPFQLSIALGGNGGGGGDAGEIVSVVTSDSTTIDTTGTNSYGIAAQSIGGGGGNGGSGLAGTYGPGSISVSVGVGGKGGVAGDGKLVEVDNESIITTSGDFSTGIVAQSIGGGGGNGGSAGALTVGGSLGVGVTLGGDGSAGGVGGEADIVNSGTIKTGGNNAIGIFAQSIGGSGGNGGSSLSGSAGLAAVGVSIAGGGGDGDNGGLVDIQNEGGIATRGNNSSGIFAQSVGGGGGNGGNATSIAIAGPLAVTVGVGGSGASGGFGGNVVVANDSVGVITTKGINSDGIFAQSIGGGGGSGGNATTASLAFPVEIEGVEIPAISASVALGGSGGDGGAAGTVDVENWGSIETSGLLSNGIFAQSVGGSGGRGGNATNIQITVDALFAGSVVIGGSGGDGGIGNVVTADNYGQILTHSDFASGIFAQSVGGGGGLGGNATTVSLSLTPPPTSVDDLVPTPSMSFHVAVGGDGGAGGIGGTVDVTNDATIITEGHFATGIMAQSVGGSGGVGGDARVISVELTADPMDFLPWTDLMSFNTTMVFGGDGGEGGDGGDVTVTNTLSDLEMEGIATSGAFSHGIVAQSVGGNGGAGGSAMTFEFSNADLPIDIPVLDDITGLTTIEMTLQGSGGAGGDGGDITLNSNGSIWTEGDFAMSLVAQSVAGGGGLAGFYNPHGIINNEIGKALFNTFIDTDAGLSFAGSVGGVGTAGNIIVGHTGNIQTLGDAAHGLFAQSAAGQGAAGNVDITFDGSINALGDYAYGIYAQSGGGSGNGDITLTINDGVVTGGTGMGAGVFISGGADNGLFNHGTITSVPGVYGRSIVADGGGEYIENYGTVTGNVFLGAGANAFINQQDAMFNTGAVAELGTGNTLNNDGILSPGGSENVFTTELTGNLVQTSLGSLFVDMDSSNGEADRFDASGTVDLAGVADLNILNPGWAVPGTYQTTIVTGVGGATDSGLSLGYQASAVMNYSLLYPNSTDVVLSTNIDFNSHPGLNHNQRAIGEAVNTIQRAGGSSSFAPFVSELVGLPDVQAIGEAYDSMSPESYDAMATTTFEVTQQYTQTLVKRMHSIRSYLDTTGLAAGVRQIRSNGLWVSGFGETGDLDANNSFTGFDYNLGGIGIGLDRLFKDGLLGGISYGQSRTTIDLDSNKGDGAIDSYVFSLYGSFFSDRYYLDTALSYAKESYENRRRVEVGALSDLARSNHDGDLFSFYTEAGYNFEMHKWLAQPFAALQYGSLDEERYRESGAGGASLIVDKRKTESLVTDLGLRFNRPFKKADLVYIPEISAAWRHDYDIDERGITAAFDGSPGVSFTTESRNIDKDGLLIGVGIALLNTSGMSMDLRYDFETRGDYSAQRIAGGLRYEF